MSDLMRVGEAGSHVWQWKTDGRECPVHEFPPCYREVLIEVKGDLGGTTLEVRGGLTKGELPFLASTKITPWLSRVPSVLFLAPVTEAAGVTITIRGIL